MYDHGYDAKHPTIRNFWSVVHSFSLEDVRLVVVFFSPLHLCPFQKKRLLAFTTGSDRAPIGGLGNLQFVITQQPDSERLPTSHTCFNHLILPAYITREKLETKLRTVIANSQGFGML